jgi:hypothetical protein
VHEEPGGDVEARYPYSAYVTWGGLDDEHISLLGLGDLAPGPVSDLWNAVRRAIRAYFAGASA